MEKFERAEILVSGFVQGVGFRYFVYRNAVELDLNGYTQNLFTGEVITVAEGPKYLLEELYNRIKIGPSSSQVRGHNIKWSTATYEFLTFEIKR